MKKLLTVLALLALLMVPAQADTWDDIEQHCQSEWSSNYRMRAYCLDRQNSGVKDYNKFLKEYQLLDESLTLDTATKRQKVGYKIMVRCQREWYPDFAMMAYCIKNQTRAVARLGILE